MDQAIAKKMQNYIPELYGSEQFSQFPSAVAAFSSQYGSERGSYSAGQVIGSGPTVFPRYGDFCGACVLRYYGKWWSRVPSKPPLVGIVPNCYPPGYCTEDFLEVAYQQAVYLARVRVYETFIPGCIVGIHAGTHDGKWCRVWHRSGPSREPHTARVFEPQLTKLPPQPVNRLRLEFNSTLAEYYTEIDTVELIGSNSPPCAELSQEMQALHIGTSSSETFDAGEPSAAGWFGNWPPELLTRLLGWLDLQSLLRLSQSCRLLREFCSDPLLYKSVSLKPHCMRVTDQVLASLTDRVISAQQLELSWCSGFGPAAFRDFLLATGSCLTTLRLASCSFLDDTCLAVVGSHCVSLIDMDLSGCPHQVTPSGFAALTPGLSRLSRLNLYRAGITWEPLSALLANNAGLRHLNLGACPGLAEVGDSVARALSRSCRGLRSLDLWRNRGLSSVGVEALAEGCPDLEELDIGWCNQVDSGSACLAHLAQRCVRLRKLFLTANRTVSDADLQQIGSHCRELRQLDILGTSRVSLDAVVSVLRSCPQLEMFDVSFCGGIKRSAVEAIRQSFPQCNIQMSFQDEVAA